MLLPVIDGQTNTHARNIAHDGTPSHNKNFQALTSAPSGRNTNVASPECCPLSRAEATSSETRSRSRQRMKSRSEVPVQRESMFLAPRLFFTSSILTVRKSMLYRASPAVFGTVEC